MANSGYSRRALGRLAGGAVLVSAAPVRAAPTRDPFEDLIEDHRRALDLVKRMQATDDVDTRERVRLLGELRRELTRHAAVEEYVFYPAFRQNPENARKAAELSAEHAEVKTLLYELELTPRSDSRWSLVAGDLARLLGAHMKREEEDVFPRQKASLNATQLEFLAELARRERGDA